MSQEHIHHPPLDQEERPGMTDKVKQTLTHVKDRITGHRAAGERVPHLPPATNSRDDPQMRVGHPSAVYGGSCNGSPTSTRRPHSPRSPRVGNPEFAVGVGEQAADTVMPGHPVEFSSSSSSSNSNSRSDRHAQSSIRNLDYAPIGVPHDQHHPSPLRDPERQHVVGETGGEDDVVHSSGIVGKFKDLVTGQKPGQGTGTNQATVDQVAETRGERESYTQDPEPGDIDCFGKTRNKIHKDQSKPATGVWPSPAKPDYHHMPGAVHTDEEGAPVEGPKEEGKAPKTEGMMTKIMDKLHIGQQKGSHVSAAGEGNKPTTTVH